MRATFLIVLLYFLLISGIAWGIYRLRKEKVEASLANATEQLISQTLSPLENLGNLEIKFDGRFGAVSGICARQGVMDALRRVVHNIQSGSEKDLADKVWTLQENLQLAPQCLIYEFEKRLHASGKLPEAVWSLLKEDLRGIAKGSPEHFSNPEPSCEEQPGDAIADPEWLKGIRTFLPAYLKGVESPNLSLQHREILLRGNVRSEEAKDQLAKQLQISLAGWPGKILNEISIKSDPSPPPEPDQSQAGTAVEPGAPSTVTLPPVPAPVAAPNPSATAAPEQAKPETLATLDPDTEKRLKQSKIFFETNSSKLGPEQLAKLRDMAPGLAKVNKGKLIILGFADKRGSSALNLKLSELRCEAVRKELESLGVPTDLLIVRHKGADASSKKDQFNRRVEFLWEQP